ncbi:unnamed protein product [Gongylonema pulchrum]|uniref:Ovule protein n=1 Tax=Gongylonema pulchrum TaxID=637853 RepID=A0A183ED64_9BILA|nr:unnamed protein product [Gongylonema pulchrum]
MARRPLLSPFTPRFNRFFDDFRDFDLDRTFQRPYWVDCSFENSHKLGSGVGQVCFNQKKNMCKKLTVWEFPKMSGSEVQSFMEPIYST